MSRLTEFAVAKRSVTLLLAGALFIAGIFAWGSLKQELLPGHRVPGHHRHRAAARRRRGGRRRAGDQADRARHLRRAPPRGPPVHVGQLARARRRAVLVRHRRQGDPGRDRAEPAERGPARRRSTPQVTALNINASPVIIASIAATTEDGLDDAAAQSPGRDRARRSWASRASAASTSRAARSSGSPITLDPDKLAANGIVARPGHRGPRGEQPDLPVRPDHADGTQDPGLDDRPHRRPSTRSSSMVVGVKTAAGGVPGAGARRAGGRPRASAAPGRTGGSGAPRGPRRIGRARRPAGAHPGHDRRPRHGRDRRRRHDRLRPHQRQAVALAVRLQDLERQHRRGRRRRHRQARRARASSTRTPSTIAGRLGPVRLHQGVARRPASGGRPRRPLRDPDDLPVPVQPPLHPRRRGQHPAVAS